MILDRLAAHAKDRVKEAKAKLPLAEIKSQARQCPVEDFVFEQAMAKEGLGLIAEVKKASPSKGVIAEDFPYLDIARSYQDAQVDALSVLTEDKYFLGSDEIFEDIRQEVTLPMLRKDFTVDEYQIYQSKLMGADAVLLICSLLDGDEGRLKDYLAICQELGLSALVETHDSDEIDLAIRAGARMVGVNNRNLKDFTVNFDNAKALRDQVPADLLFIAESGVKEPADIQAIGGFGADGVLVGEALMRSDHIPTTVEAFKKAGELTHGD